MLQLDNPTPFLAALTVLADEEGVDCLFVCIKGTFTLERVPRVAEAQRPIALVDRYRSDPTRSSLLEAGEHHIGKAGTDVLLEGHARPPDGRPTTLCPVSVTVGERRSVIAVHGDRRWRAGGRASSPEPFDAMPLIWERALGGRYEGRNAALREVAARNPVGVGLDRTTGAPLPNLEDPEAPVAGGGGPSVAVGYGPVAPHWEPRRGYAGTFDAAWVRRRAPLLPPDYDRRFGNVAAGPLAFDRFLVGGEPVELIGVSPRGPLTFELPRCGLAIAGRVGGDWLSMQPELETIVLLPDDGVMTLSWRARLRCDRRVLDVERISITTERTRAAA